jgi:hypothetical protein
VVVVVVVTPIPIGSLIRVVPSPEVHVVAMGIAFPLPVVNSLAIPVMAVVVIRIVVAGMDRASGQEYRDRKRSREQRQGHATLKCLHRVSFLLAANRSYIGCTPEIGIVGIEAFFGKERLSQTTLRLRLRGSRVGY